LAFTTTFYGFLKVFLNFFPKLDLTKVLIKFPKTVFGNANFDLKKQFVLTNFLRMLWIPTLDIIQLWPKSKRLKRSPKGDKSQNLITLVVCEIPPKFVGVSLKNVTYLFYDKALATGSSLIKGQCDHI